MLTLPVVWAASWGAGEAGGDCGSGSLRVTRGLAAAKEIHALSLIRTGWPLFNTGVFIVPQNYQNFAFLLFSMLNLKSFQNIYHIASHFLCLPVILLHYFSDSEEYGGGGYGTIYIPDLM